MSKATGDRIINRIPPQNIDTEIALIGSCLLNPESLHEILTTISPESFYSDRHKIIFKSVLKLFAASQPIDLVSISADLKDSGQLERVGGAKYLSQLVDSVPSSAHVDHYAGIVKKNHTLRELIHAAEKIVEMGYANNIELDHLLDQAEKHIFNITSDTSDVTLHEAKSLLGEAWDHIEKMHSGEVDVRGTPTGFGSIDNKLSGLQPSDLIILAARPSVGKTSLALDIARHAAVKEKIPVAIFSLEMSAQQLIHRMISAEAAVDSWKLKTGKSNEKDFEKIQEALGKLSEAPIFIDDKPANTITSMRSVCRKLKSEHGLGLVVVDYLQLMMPTDSRNSDNMVQQVTEISRSLKALARELEVPVLALSQLSRAVEQRGGRPRLSDLRDSGSIEQDADVVMFIHREDRYRDEADKDNMAEICIEKHRNGATGIAQLYFDDTKSTFLNLDTQHDNANAEGF